MSVLHWLSPRLLDLFVSWLLAQLRPIDLGLALFSQMPHNGTLVKGCKVRTSTPIPSNNSDSHIKGSPLAVPLFWVALVSQLIIVWGYFWFYRKEQLGQSFSLTILRTVPNIQYQHDLNGHNLSLNLSGPVLDN